MDIKVGDYVEDRNGNVGYIVNVYPWNGFSYELSRDNKDNNVKTVICVNNLKDIKKEFVRVGKNNFDKNKYRYDFNITFESEFPIDKYVMISLIKSAMNEYSRMVLPIENVEVSVLDKENE